MSGLHTPRRALARVGALIVAGLFLAAAPSAAQDASPTSSDSSASDAVERAGDGIDVVQVEGLLDPPNVELIRSALDRAEERGSTLVVFQLDSGGAVDVDVDDLVERVSESSVPVVVWVGPSGAGAKGAAVEIAQSAGWLAVSQGSGIGPAHPSRLDDPGQRTPAETEAVIAGLLAENGRDESGAARLTTERVPATEARELGVIDDAQPTVGDVIVSLDGETIQTAGGPVVVSTAELVETDAGVRRRPNQDVRFYKLSLVGQAQHTLATPWVAYFLFVAGLSLIVFEFYTASIGIAGGVGALALIGSFAGFAHLPVTWWALGLIAVGLAGLTIDVQAGRVGPWSVIGFLCLVAGSVTLYGGSSRLDPAWWMIVIVLACVAVFFLGAMPSMLRARFSTPTMGREGMIGEMGVAEVAVDPEGVVRVRDALWRARTNRATPIAGGESVRVVAVEGVLLEVEPETGGARDYRDRARRS